MASTNIKLPNTDEPLEEEAVPGYDPAHFYQIDPGDVIGNGRYSVVSKLGWGRHSTVWLARDVQRWRWQSPRYVSIKINSCDEDPESIQQQYALLQRLTKADPNHRGFSTVRKALESFELKTGSGTHVCIVYEPLRETMDVYRRRFAEGRLPLPLLKAYTKVLLAGLDLLHQDCGIIHTGRIHCGIRLKSDRLMDPLTADLKLDNILVGFEDESVLKLKAAQFQTSENLFKQGTGRRIYQSRSDFGPLQSYITPPVIGDLDSAEDVDMGAHPTQPDVYRAPEVVLGWGWSSSADIWNLGHLVWTLASGKDLFTSLYTEKGTYDAAKHLAQMIAVLGPPSPTLIQERSHSGWKWSPAIVNQDGDLCEDARSFYRGPFFESTSGEFLYPKAVPLPQSLDDLAGFINTAEERAKFVDFLGKMLSWDPTQRLSERMLFDHEWLDLEPS
ncbi:CMGC kinase [Lecanosticta acicola]|uniref:non-specific serine/threonine protein kinase n=1 Tax=Lecanosticta acicola TaxID=111012 RepID=A0AAI8Z602_9PEZI|nr:CMGC kinase [Lecanosticta acicola]